MPLRRPNEVLLDEIPSSPKRVLPARTGPIQIKPGEGGRLIVVVPYDSDRVAKIKTFAGRRWHREDKFWTVPYTDGAVARLRALFAEEGVAVDPSLHPVKVLNNQEPPADSEILQAAAPHPKLLDQVREAIRTRHYSHRTEKAYVGWIIRFIFFQNKRHPAEMGEAEIGQFLSSLASDSHVSASTQNQALNAILFLY
ncbi:MAG: phage integrase N-terminal SAM-like domain-containing protein, partial [candidate division NC10 bacterium]|nr:phage integrase N-terminal SAM-like domain-containing protein [candidate division NC10 bacterium]